MTWALDEAGAFPLLEPERWRFAVCATCDATLTQRPYTSADRRVTLWNPPICAECRRKVDETTARWLRERYGTDLEEAA